MISRRIRSPKALGNYSNSNAKEKATRESSKKEPESATKVTARVLVPTRSESPKR
jgi:hypothetical protein